MSRFAEEYKRYEEYMLNTENMNVGYLALLLKGFTDGWTMAEASNPLNHSHEDKAVYGGLEEDV